MGQAFLKMLAGAGRSFSISVAGDGSYIRPTQGDSRQDFARISGDMKRVGTDLRKVASKELAKRGK